MRSTGFEEVFTVLDRILLHFQTSSGITIVSKMGNVLWVQLCLVCCGSQVTALLPLKLYFQWVCFFTMADILLTYFHWLICPINLQPSLLLKFTLLASISEFSTTWQKCWDENDSRGLFLACAAMTILKQYYLSDFTLQLSDAFYFVQEAT